MEELKKWWMTIVFAGCVALAVGYMFKRNEQFQITVRGGLFEPSYNVDIPMKWMTPELAEKHQDAYFHFVESLGKDA